MKFKVALANGKFESRTIILTTWNGRQHSCNFFDDAEIDAHDLPCDPGSDEHNISEEQYEELKSWWEDTVRAANNGEWTEFYGYYNKDECGELCLDAD